MTTAEHVHEELEHLNSYHGFLTGLRYVVLAFIVAASFLVLAFCTGAGFFRAAIVAAIELGVGLYLTHDRPETSWVSEAATLVMTTAAENGRPIERRIEAEAEEARLRGDGA